MLPELHEGEYFPLKAKGSPPASPRAVFAESRGIRHWLAKYFPITEWLPNYRLKDNGLKDVVGALTLGCILVAQSMAHADLCDVALINGPYSCILPPIIYSLFGTCIHSSIGTGGLVSLLTGIHMRHHGDLQQRTEAVPIFTLIVGVLIALMGLLRLSFLVRFLSRPALSGFITASAILIMLSQVMPILGLQGHPEGFLRMVASDPGALRTCSLPTLALSTFSVLFLTCARRLKALHWSLALLGDVKELVLLVSSAVLCYAVSGSSGIAVIGAVPQGLPAFKMPLRAGSDIYLAKEMLPGASLVALVTFLSSFAGAKKFAMMDGYHVSAMNELLGLGFANMGGAFFGSVPTQIGLSRMGIAYSAGVKSQLGANVYVAGVVALAIKFFSAYLYYVPRCVLNSIIICGSSHLMEWDQLWWLWSLRGQRTRFSRIDIGVWWVSFLSTLIIGAFEGIIVTVLASLVLILYIVVNPPMVMLGYLKNKGRWMNIHERPDARARHGLLVFRIEGPIFYANFERVQEWLEETEVEAGDRGWPIRAIIFSASTVPFMDTTAVIGFRTMMEAYRRRRIDFMIANATGSVMRIFRTVLGGSTYPVESLESHWTVQECIAYLESRRRDRLVRFNASLDGMQSQRPAGQRLDGHRRGRYASSADLQGMETDPGGNVEPGVCGGTGSPRGDVEPGVYGGAGSPRPLSRASRHQSFAVFALP